MKKRFFSIMLATLVLFVGASIVDAKSYTAYKQGDIITVNLSKTVSGEFYVVEDSDSSSTTVTALMKGYVDENTYTYEETNNLITTMANSWENITSVRIPSTNDLFDDEITFKDPLLAQAIQEPTWVKPNTSEATNYWLSDISFDGYRAAINGMDSSSHFSIMSKEVTEKLYVRLMVTVEKDYVVGGVTETEDEKLWKSFVEKYKTTELMNKINTGSTTVTSTDDSLKVVFTSDEGENVTVNFTYVDGILTYVPTTDKTKVNMNNISLYMVEDLFVVNCIQALVDLKSYTGDEINTNDDWYENLTLEENGVEIKVLEYTEEYNDGNSTSSFSTETITSFKLDIKNGIRLTALGEPPLMDDSTDNAATSEEDNTTSTEGSKEENIENPNTGVYFVYGLVLTVVVIGGISYLVVSKKNKFPQI